MWYSTSFWVDSYPNRNRFLKILLTMILLISISPLVADVLSSSSHWSPTASTLWMYSRAWMKWEKNQLRTRGLPYITYTVATASVLAPQHATCSAQCGSPSLSQTSMCRLVWLFGLEMFRKQFMIFASQMAPWILAPFLISLTLLQFLQVCSIDITLPTLLSLPAKIVWVIESGQIFRINFYSNKSQRIFCK